MVSNQELVRTFREMAQALELLGENRFRINAFQRAARTLEGLTEEVAELAGEDPGRATARLSTLPGVGPGMARRILESLERGALREHEDLLERVPRGLFDLLQVPGLGPKAVRTLWRELNVTSVPELEARLRSRELAELPRMGPRSVENLRQALAFMASARQRVPLGLAHVIALDLTRRLRQVAGVLQTDWAGSLRRGRETVGDVDLLAACEDPEAVRREFLSLPGLTRVLAQGPSRSSARIELQGVRLQVDLRIVPQESYGAALLYFTGSKEHNVWLRERAIRAKMHLNEYGLFPGAKPRPRDAGLSALAAATEEEIYAALDLSWIPPELREDPHDREDPPGDLVETRHIRSELHSHTTASDGQLSIEELARQAKSRGLHTLAVTDHSQSSVIANGLSPDRLRRHVKAIRRANEAVSGITLLAGAEVDILPDGRLDYDDGTLALLDVVVASPHSSLGQGPQEATRRLVAAIRHPRVHILGHPTGRKIGRRPGLAPDMPTLFSAAAECDTALEINSNWRRLDLCDHHVRGALAHGCLLAIHTDTHRTSDFDHLPYGVTTGRRGGLTKSDCINTWPAKKLHTWLQDKTRRAGS